MGNNKSLQLVNHGVSTSLVENMKTGAKKLFELPIEEKKKLWQREGDLEGFGQAFVLSDQQKLEWADAFLLTTLPSHLRKPHLFNQIPHPLRFPFFFSYTNNQILSHCMMLLPLWYDSVTKSFKKIQELIITFRSK